MSQRVEGEGQSLSVHGPLYALLTQVLNNQNGRILNVLDMPLSPGTVHTPPLSYVTFARDSLSFTLLIAFLPQSPSRSCKSFDANVEHIQRLTLLYSSQLVQLDDDCISWSISSNTCGWCWSWNSVHLTHGAKLWFVAVSWEDGSPIEDQWLPEYFEGDQIELAAHFKWEAILLEEGSTLCVLSALCITEF